MNLDDLDRRVLRVEEAAAILGVAVSTAYAACRRGDLPAFRVGRRWVVPGAALARLLRGDLAPQVSPGARRAER